MQLHRNSQKRFYGKDYIYFVTVVTQNRFPYFEEKVFCEVFWENLKMCRKIKGFEIHGWFLGYDHFHLLITPNDKWNISNIMQFLKRHVSRNINEIMDSPIEGDIGQCRLQNNGHDEFKSKIARKNQKLKSLQKQFHQKYPHESMVPFLRFQWQRSFHDHVIRNKRDFETHMRYIEYNPIKHKMPEGWGWWGLESMQNEGEKTFSHLHFVLP